MTSTRERASWLVLADELIEAGDPLGEIIQLTLTLEKGEERARRVGALERAWEARHPWARFWYWTEEKGLELKLRERGVDAALAHLDELRALPPPVHLQGNNDANDPDGYAFDETFSRLTYLERWRTNEGTGMYGPSFEDDWHHHRKLQIVRVADRAVLHTISQEASWRDPFWRGGVLYAKDSWPEVDVVIWGA